MKTPQQSYPKLAEALGVPAVYLKREDLHKYGSHKGRSIPLMIKSYVKNGIRNFVISSSGNAALAAIMAVSQHNKNNVEREISITVFVGMNVSTEKLKKLQSGIMNNESKIKVNQIERPKQEAFKIDKDGEGKNLRQSTDDLALEGYNSLAEDLNKIPNLEAIFIPTSSGTTAQAVGEAFANFEISPQIHIVQTTECHPIVQALGVQIPEFTRRNDSGARASAIVDKVAHRKDKVLEVVKNSNGSGWIITDEEIIEAQKITRDTTKIDISPNSALAIAGLKKSVASGQTFSGSIACLITGA